MGFVYTDTPSADQMLQAINPKALASAGATTYLIIPYRCRIMNFGFAPITQSVASAMTMQMRLGAQVAAATSSSFASVVLATSTVASTAVLIAAGQTASYALPADKFGNIGDVLEIVTSGGHDGSGAAIVYATVRRSDN